MAHNALLVCEPVAKRKVAQRAKRRTPRSANPMLVAVSLMKWMTSKFAGYSNFHPCPKRICQKFIAFQILSFFIDIVPGSFRL